MRLPSGKGARNKITVDILAGQILTSASKQIITGNDTPTVCNRSKIKNKINKKTKKNNSGQTGRKKIKNFDLKLPLSEVFRYLGGMDQSEKNELLQKKKKKNYYGVTKNTTIVYHEFTKKKHLYSIQTLIVLIIRIRRVILNFSREVKKKKKCSCAQDYLCTR